MITIKTYLYPNVAQVQFFQPGIFTTRNRVVYSRPIKVYQGIDNPIQVTIKNQDQKSIDLTGYEVHAIIQDPTNKVYIVNYGVQFADITNGLGNFIILQDDLAQLDQRFYKLTFKSLRISDNAENPLYIDDNYGVPLDLEVLPAYYTTVAGIRSSQTLQPGDPGYIG
jgi:hypothetical protein